MMDNSECQTTPTSRASTAQTAAEDHPFIPRHFAWDNARATHNDDSLRVQYCGLDYFPPKHSAVLPLETLQSYLQRYIADRQYPVRDKTLDGPCLPSESPFDVRIEVDPTDLSRVYVNGEESTTLASSTAPPRRSYLRQPCVERFFHEVSRRTPRKKSVSRLRGSMVLALSISAVIITAAWLHSRRAHRQPG